MKQVVPHPRRPATLGMPVGPRGRWAAAPLPLLAAALVAGMALVMVTVETRRQGGEGRGKVPAAAMVGPATAPRAAADPLGADGPVGLDGLPMFDEIDAGVRDGVASLAASLLDVPDWTMLAGLDARAVLDPEVWSPVAP